MDLDQGGNSWQRVRAWLGPSLGWVDRTVKPETYITTPGTYNVQPGDNVIFIKSLGVSINLPDVVAWVSERAGQPATGFERSLWIKDFGYAGASNVLISAFGTQTIDTLASTILAFNFGLMKLWPLNDLSGWWADIGSSGGGGGGGGITALNPGGNTGPIVSFSAGSGLAVSRPSANIIQYAGVQFTNLAEGDVPASGGGIANFLRADGSWAVPPGTVSGVSSLNTLIGALSITAGSGIAVTPSGTNIQVAGTIFGAAAQGEVAASGGGTTNFLRADGSWAAPPGGGGGGIASIDGMTGPAITFAAGAGITIVDASNVVTITNTGLPMFTSGTANLSTTPASTTSSTLIAANGARKGLILQNTDSNAALVKFGAVASAVSFSIRVPGNSNWEMTDTCVWTGRIDAIWSPSTGGGAMVVTEMV